MSEFDTRRVDALAAAEIGEYPAVKAPADPIFVDIEDPANLESLFYKLDVLKYALIVECKEIDHLITVLQKERAEKEAEYAPEIEEVEKKIMAEILKHGESFKCSYGSAASGKHTRELHGMIRNFRALLSCILKSWNAGRSQWLRLRCRSRLVVRNDLQKKLPVPGVGAE
ncbi:hypothetical protein [Methanosarcina horonobensis]|uniref:hypothetical protein n=1 Tax=Methanosarcina horonobensis TaxID=418008 RepID=UPI000B2E2865|nr:hypothetical protein [Methanosarcina horonobensis]